MRRLLQTTSVCAFAALIVVFTFSTSCAQLTANQNLKYTEGYKQILMGKVVSAQTGQPIANAEVTIMTSGVNTNSENNVPYYGMRIETTVTTGQNGTFLVKNLSPGPHTIKVQKDNYKYWQNTVVMMTGMNNYYKYNGLTSFGYYMHGYNYPYSYGYRQNNNEAQPPFHGFFRPDSDATGLFHGVFSKHDTNNNNNNNNNGDNDSKHNYRTNSYSKGLFLIIRLQSKNQ